MSQQSLKCFLCPAKEIITENDAENCSKCGTFFHKKCVNLAHLLLNGSCVACSKETNKACSPDLLSSSTEKECCKRSDAKEMTVENTDWSNEDNNNSSSLDNAKKDQETEFVSGEDVLLRQIDGKFYLGTLVKVDWTSKRCLLEFLDNTSSWWSTKNIKKMAPCSEVTCIICKKSRARTHDSIIVCIKCARGYHQFCHKPKVSQKEVNTYNIWKCKKCRDTLHQSATKKNSITSSETKSVKKSNKSGQYTAIKQPTSSNQSKDTVDESKATKIDQSKEQPSTSSSSKQIKLIKNPLKRTSEFYNESPPSTASLYIKKVCSGTDKVMSIKDDVSQLPYDREALNWDTRHRVNVEQIYCYCGLNGEWFSKMLQCNRCNQWFHEKCIRCLKYPMLCGDSFYTFVCSVCNGGEEILTRLELKWIDLVHLILFNIVINSAKKYHDFETVIMQFANENWEQLQLPEKIHNASINKRKKKFHHILSTNKMLFKCGKEIKKSASVWGLRERVPPIPASTLPSKQLEELNCSPKQFCGDNNKIPLADSVNM